VRDSIASNRSLATRQAGIGRAKPELIVPTENVPSATDFASLLCSRLCHDAIGPVGAIMNGLELLEDEGGAEMRELALGLVRSSARKAAAVLEFARLAYGSGGGQTRLGRREIERLTRAVLHGERLDVVFTRSDGDVPIIEARLLLNLIRFAAAAIPRGGTLTVTDAADAGSLAVIASGAAARRPDAAAIAISGAAPHDLDSHSVTAYLLHLLAEEAGMAISIEAAGGSVRFTATTQVAA
jgi:histidine phosphotransferase ChpT